MKFIAANYTKPNGDFGTFTNVYIEDIGFTHSRNVGQLNVAFEMYHIHNGNRIVIGSGSIFCSDGILPNVEGSNYAPDSTNKTAYCRQLNPDYDGTNDKYIGDEIPLIRFLADNGSILPNGYEITDYGFPNYTDALKYFSGGSMESPEISVTNPIAIGFLLNKLIINDEPIGNQFQIVE